MDHIKKNLQLLFAKKQVNYMTKVNRTIGDMLVKIKDKVDIRKKLIIKIESMIGTPLNIFVLYDDERLQSILDVLDKLNLITKSEEIEHTKNSVRYPAIITPENSYDSKIVKQTIFIYGTHELNHDDNIESLTNNKNTTEITLIYILKKEKHVELKYSYDCWGDPKPVFIPRGTTHLKIPHLKYQDLVGRQREDECYDTKFINYVNTLGLY